MLLLTETGVDKVHKTSQTNNLTLIVWKDDLLISTGNDLVRKSWKYWQFKVDRLQIILVAIWQLPQVVS